MPDVPLHPKRVGVREGGMKNKMERGGEGASTIREREDGRRG